ncbi:YaiO family outer membrane beta-barrel protein [Pelobium sp.]|nr:YaiO family outer membrane beta-barrel protein [Pelobium sp.]MDA9555601.1 YaiO family outer membrane beta-barrel protein [Pelobium sp.]
MISPFSMTKKSIQHIFYRLNSKGVFLFFLTIFLGIYPSFAQDNLSSDELFVKARKLAFDDKNYTTAIAVSKQALLKSPNYADIKIFLGRLYTFTDKVDSARTVFNEVLTKDSTNEDAALAFGNLEYWNNQSSKSLLIVNQGLKYHPQSQDLLLLKAKVLKDLRQYEAANATLNQLLKLNSKLTIARALSESIKDESSKNSIGIGYDYVDFDKQFADPWHLANMSYGRQTKLGSVVARFNYGNRFKTNGTQIELDAYPKISKVFYAYVSGGYGGDKGVFPKYRSGFSLYANLPAAFEGEVGFRTLSFDATTWIYTASVGKYYKNYWFNLRTFLTPSNSAVSQSFSLNVRYYYGSANDYLSLSLGTGISPDNQRNITLYNNGNAYRLKSNNVSFGYNKAIKSTTVIGLKGAFERQEYLPRTKGNQFSLSIALNQRF